MPPLLGTLAAARGWWGLGQCQCPGSLPISNVKFFPGEHGDAMAEVGSGGFCGVPVPPYTLGTPQCPHPSLGTLQCSFSSHMRHHIWEDSLGTW